MVMKKLCFFLLAILCLTGTTCKKNESKENNVNEERFSLTNTRWKLIGIVNTETGTLKKLEPKDCETCYTLVFDTDIFEGRSVEVDFFSFWYNVNYTLSIIQFDDIQRPDAEDIYDGEIFLENIMYNICELVVNEDKTYSYQLVHFELRDTELKLYYNDKKKYLIFNKIEL